jgi:hypothetical protein
LKEIRRTRAERCLQWHAEKGHENILFTDEKFFTIEDQYNNQNNQIYAQTCLEVRSESAGMPSLFLRHGLVEGVPSVGDTSSFLQERGETDVRVYQEDVLQGVMKQLNMTLFSGQEWVFQQESVPAQNPRRLRRNVPAFISAENWSWGSPDLNPRDYKLWAVLENMAFRKRHNNLDSLKRSLLKAAAEIPLETVHGAIAVAGASQRLRRGRGRSF